MAAPVGIILLIAVAIGVVSGGGFGLRAFLRRRRQRALTHGSSNAPPPRFRPPPATGGNSNAGSNLRLRRRRPANRGNSVRNQASTDNRSICVVCQLPERKVRLFPCGHTDVCECCVDQLNLGKDGCPTCGEDIEGSDDM